MTKSILSFFIYLKKRLTSKIINFAKLVLTKIFKIEIKILKHYPNYFNKRIPYKITALFKDQKLSLIFFSKLNVLFILIFL